MLTEDNSFVRAAGQQSGPLHQGPAADLSPRTTEPNHDRIGSKATADRALRATTERDNDFIGVTFDLNDPEQAQKLERYRTAFGEAHTEIEPLGEGRAILKLYLGGAKGLR
jgi:hypothetical protein